MPHHYEKQTDSASPYIIGTIFDKYRLAIHNIVTYRIFLLAFLKSP